MEQTHNCGCVVHCNHQVEGNATTIAYCPIHAAAPKLLEAAQRINRDIYAMGAAALGRMSDMDALDAAIAKSEGK